MDSEPKLASLNRIDRRTFLALCSSLPIAIPVLRRQEVREPSAKREIQVVRTKVFATTPGGGNPCSVVLDSGLSDAMMQDLARHFGEDTAFLLPPNRPDAQLRIRYFVPNHEMGISGHATIAAVTVALQAGTVRSGRIRVETMSGTFAVTSRGERGSISITLEQTLPEFARTAGCTQTARVLSIDPSDINLDIGPIQSVSASRPKLIVPLRSVEVLNSLKPDFEELWNLCDRTKVSGLYAFAVPSNGGANNPTARQFPLRAGFPEDPATGVAAAALGAYLTRYSLRYASGLHLFEIMQGFAMGAPSRITTLLECRKKAIVRIAIRGTAEIVARESLNHGIFKASEKGTV